jgi:hypothetical protein
MLIEDNLLEKQGGETGQGVKRGA